MVDYEGLVNLVQKVEIEPVQTTVQELLDQGNSPQDIIAKGIVVALDIPKTRSKTEGMRPSRPGRKAASPLP